MRESVPTARYSPVCNVLRQWKTSLILTYRVYRLYDTTKIGIMLLQLTSSSFLLCYNMCKVHCILMNGEEVNVLFESKKWLAYTILLKMYL